MKRLVAIAFAVALRAVGFADVLPINQFGGLNSDDSPLTLQNGQTPDSDNVLTDLGPGVQGRKGFISFSTEPSSGLWEFPLSDGTRYLITKSGGYLKAATSDGVFDILISTVPEDRVTAATPLGDKFYFADTLNGLKYWNGTSVTVASAAMTVDKLVTFKGRLAAAGKSGAQRTIYLSKYLDGTSWTAPTNPSDDDAAQITVSGALDEVIQALYATFQDKLMWFKSNSFGGIYGSRRSNFIQRTFSDRVGVSSPETVQDCDGKLRWLGANRLVWEFDGATFHKISEDVDTLFSTISQGDSAAKSNLQTSQIDWDAGSQDPANFASSTDLAGSLTPKTTTFLDTTEAEFTLGTHTQTSATANSGSLQLATAAALSFVDTTQADFGAGTLTNIDTATISGGSAILSLGSSSIATSSEPAAGSPYYSTRCPGLYNQSFVATTSFVTTSVAFNLQKTGSPGDYIVRLMENSGGSPGTILVTAPIPAASISTTGDWYQTSWTSSVQLTSGQTYWLQIASLGTCTIPPPGVHAFISVYSTDFSTTTRHFRVYGHAFQSSGNIVSQTFDVGFTTNTWLWNWSTLSASGNLPVGTSFSFQTQTSADGTNWDSLVAVSTGSSPASTVRRYIRYKASFATTDGSTSPVLNDVTLAMSSRLRPNGNFISRTFDTGLSTPTWGLFNRSIATVGSGGTSSFQTEVSNDGVSWDSSVTATSGVELGSARKRYIRYVWQSTATSASSHDRISDVTITAKSTGVFTTEAISIGSLVSAWGPVTVNGADSGGSYTIAFGTSSNGTNFTFTTISNNTTPSVSTAPYAAVRITFDLDVATDTPRIDDITINWTEGSNVRAASTYLSQRYWLSVAVGASSNNRILVYDKRQQWQRYTGIVAAAFTFFNSVLYFGNSSGIFQAESGYNDNGASVASYYTSPTFAPAGLDAFAKYSHLYTTTDQSDSLLTMAYQVDGTTTSYSLGSSSMNVTPGIQVIKAPFSVDEVQQSKMVNFKWSVSGTSFWRVLLGTLYYAKDALPF